MFLRLFYWAKWNKFGTYLLMSLFIVCAIIKYYTIDQEPEQQNNNIVFEENYTCSSSLGVRELFDAVERLNAARELRNLATFGPVRALTPVLVVRVTRGARALRRLVASLARVADIGAAALVFSHGCYDETASRLIESITFCSVLQVYFPNSLQLFPNVFPGDEPGDCTAGTDRDCQQRRARLAQDKHHWWWTAHRVFEDVPWAHLHTGMVVFLEEDSYVLPDLLHMVRYGRAALASAPGAQLLAFGRPPAHGLDPDKLAVDTWRPPYDNGLAFNKSVWTEIKGLARHFCEYDDVSWSYSLQRALEESRRGRALMLATAAPRVVSTRLFDSEQQAMDYILALIRSSALFPVRVKAVLLFGRNGPIYQRFKTSEGNGGWWDVRDQLLCLDPLASTVTDEDYKVTPIK